jgi:glucose-1-phosphate cytidylyltransferase
MKAVILAGGLGTRISEESHLKPKPMIEIGGKPILWHIMKMYSHHGINDFVICLGYKGYVIKEYFANYFLYMSDVTFDMQQNRMEVHQRYVEPWRVTLVDTGDNTLTGGRLKRVKDHIGTESFCFTYGDGVSDVDIRAPINVEGASVTNFQEKPDGDGGWINGGFFVLEPSVLDLIEGDQTSWESALLVQLAAQGELRAYQHNGFWQALDTLRDKTHLEDLWVKGNSPWKVWV